MKFFENPEIEIIKFVMTDVITTSGDPDPDLNLGPDQLPFG